VIRSLQEPGIPIDVACGASMGALVAGSLAAGFLDPLSRWAQQLNWSHLIGFMDVMIPRSGLVEGEKISGYLREVLSDPMIENLPLPFAAVATDLKTGKEVWLREDHAGPITRQRFIDDPPEILVRLNWPTSG